MKEFLYEMLIEPFLEWSWEILMGIICWCLVLGLVVGTFIFGVWAIDSSFLQEKQGTGVIVGKRFIAAHTTISIISTGKSTVHVPVHHSDSYRVNIQVNGLNDEVAVSKYYYDDLEINEEINCVYTNGRIMDSMYIKEVK